jgi:hypothetical protein
VSEDEKDKIVLKIQKLLNLARGAGTQGNEADNAMRMALGMMRKHDLDEADVIDREVRGNAGSLTHEEADPDSKRVKQIPAWEEYLATDVAELLHCGVRHGPGRNGCMTIWVFGYKTDVAVFRWLYDYLREQIEAMASEAWKPEHDRLKNRKGVVHASERKRWKDKYRMGVFMGIKERLQDVYGREVEEPVRTSDGRELVTVKHEAMERKYGAFSYSLIPVGADLVDDTASLQGLMDADSVKINRVVNGAPTLKIGNS